MAYKFCVHEKHGGFCERKGTFCNPVCPYEEIKELAPVVHGRKIEDGDIGWFWLCSLCGECLPYGANYCPNCGARMDGAE